MLFALSDDMMEQHMLMLGVVFVDQNMEIHDGQIQSIGARCVVKTKIICIHGDLLVRSFCVSTVRVLRTE